MLSMSKTLKKYSGQSLIEVVVALGIVIIIVTAIAISTTSGLKNAQFSKNQTQATKIAQEGLEAVKVIKRDNCPVVINNNQYFWANTNQNALIWDRQQSELEGEIFQYTLSPAENCKLQDNGKKAIDQFTQTIYLTSKGNNRINITSEVEWVDASGIHNVRLETLLTDY